MRKCESVKLFDGWILLRIKAFVDANLAGLQPDGPKDVWTTKCIAWNTKQTVQIIELDPKLEVLFDDVLDRDRRLHLHSLCVRILRKQGLGVPFNGLIGNIRHSRSEERRVGTECERR